MWRGSSGIEEAGEREKIKRMTETSVQILNSRPNNFWSYEKICKLVGKKGSLCLTLASLFHFILERLPPWMVRV